MIQEILKKVINKENLSIDEAYSTMLNLMDGSYNNSQIAALLIALKSKGETAEEVGGFVKAMREKSIKIYPNAENMIDVCGTGGDSSNTFNISTAVAILSAACGISVAKHGNRAISSKSGSADVLKSLGVNVELSPKESEECIEKTRLSFLFAPLYHPAMKYAAPVRKELAMKTVFNILGPLTNPAQVKKQIVGTFNNATAFLMREAATYLNYDSIYFVCTDNKYDEITLSGKTKVYAYSTENGKFDFELTPDSFGVTQIKLESLAGGDAEFNGKIIKEIFTGEINTPRSNVICANTALALKLAGFNEDLTKCFKHAQETLVSGKAKEKLNELISFGI